jgi:hypothetical protein
MNKEQIEQAEKVIYELFSYHRTPIIFNRFDLASGYAYDHPDGEKINWTTWVDYLEKKEQAGEIKKVGITSSGESMYIINQ